MSAQSVAIDPFFDGTPIPPLGGRTDFSLYLWETIRSRGIEPQQIGPISDDPELRREFLVGARSFGLELIDLDDPAELARLKAMNPPRHPIQPQQLWIVDALNAAADEAVVEIVRRASKTTTIFAWLHGRCLERPGYQVTFSAQNGVAGSRRLREWANRLDAVTPPDDQDIPPWLRRKTPRPPQAIALFDLDGQRVTPAAAPRRGFKAMRGEVGKGIYYENGSQFLVLKPEADAYRGEAADVSWIDEAQEVDPDDGADLMAGIVPLQDTKEGSMILLSGTAGEARVGIFWEAVERIRAGDPDMGGLDYYADPDTPWDDIEDEAAAMALLQLVHPGIGTLTTLPKMLKNWRKLPKPQWAREYLSLWPESFGIRAIDANLWSSRALKRKKTRPARVAFAMAIKPRGGTAAIVAAWRDARGIGYVEVVAHQLGTGWLPVKGQTLTSKYAGSTIAFDSISSEALATVTEMSRLRPKPRTRKQTWPELAAGCVQFMRDLETGKVLHFDQVGLNDAVEKAVRREVRGENGQWLWGANSADDIVCLIAATNALANWDKYFARAASAPPAKPIMGD